MRIIPAIDVLNGKVVRLTQGDFERVQTFDRDPLELAKQYSREGAQQLHLVNLSGAKDGESRESFLRLIKGISSIKGITVQTGGGMRSLQDIERALDAGASAVVVGTLLLKEPETVRSAVLLFGSDKIIAAIDTVEDDVRMMGWKKTSGKDLRTSCSIAESIGIRQILVTDIERDGMENGPNVALYRRLKISFPRLRIIASGGVRNQSDIQDLSEAKCDAVVIGKALLNGNLSNLVCGGWRATGGDGEGAVCPFCGMGVDESAPNPWRSRRGDTVPSGGAIGAPAFLAPPFFAGKKVEWMTLAIRVIPCLDIANGRVVKGTSFGNLRDSGDPVELAKRYCSEGADELVFLDITATSENRKTVIDLVSRVADAVNIPFTIGGGVRSVADAKALLAAGADKVAINSAAVQNPSLLKEIAEAIGSANTVCAIDAKRKTEASTSKLSNFVTLSGVEERQNCDPRRVSWTVLVRGGRDDTGIDALAWAKKAVKLGAGELLVTSYDCDGQGQGFDTALLRSIKGNVSVPVIASGGAGSLQSFVDAVEIGRADAVLAASVFHFGKLTISEVKNTLSTSSFPIRP